MSICPTGYFVDVGGRVESQARAGARSSRRSRWRSSRCSCCFISRSDRCSEAAVILATLPVAFVGGIVALLVAGETWNVSSLVGLIGLFGIAVQNGSYS